MSNLADLVTGASYGSILTVQGVAESLKSGFMEFFSLGKYHAGLSDDFYNKLKNIPENKYGAVSAVAGSLATVALGGFLLYQGAVALTNKYSPYVEPLNINGSVSHNKNNGFDILVSKMN